MSIKKQIEKSIDFLENEIEKSEIMNKPNYIKKVWLIIFKRIMNKLI